MLSSWFKCMWSYSVQFSCSVVSDSVTPWTAALQASLSITNSRSFLKLMSIESVMPSTRLILCHPLLLLPPIPPSIRVFSSKSTLHMRWPKYWSFSFNISPSNEHPGLISFRMDWLNLLAVQGTLKSSPTPQFKSINFSLLNFLYSPSLLCNMQSRLVITFLSRSKCLLISWLQSPSAVILEPPKNKVWDCFHCLPIYFPWSDGTRCHNLSFLNVSFKPTFSLSSFTFIKRLFSSSSLSAIRVVSSAYLRSLIFLPAILISACASSSPAFLMMYSAYRLNKQGDNIQHWRTPFPI